MFRPPQASADAASPAVPPAPTPAPVPQSGSPDLRRMVKEKGKRLNMVDRGGLVQAIDEAVLQAVGKSVSGVDKEQLKAIALAARRGILERLKSSSKAVRGVSQSAFLQKLLAARKKLQADHARLTQELENIQGQLAQRRKAFVAEQQAFVRETVRQGSETDRALAGQIEALFDQLVAANPELADLRDQVTQLALLGAQQERQKLVDSKVDEHQRAVEQFERRIAKLNGSLQTTEQELKRIAAMKGIDPGVASIYRTVQGLSNEDDLFQVKKELLSDIFEANLVLKKQLAESR